VHRANQFFNLKEKNDIKKDGGRTCTSAFLKKRRELGGKARKHKTKSKQILPFKWLSWANILLLPFSSHGHGKRNYSEWCHYEPRKRCRKPKPKAKSICWLANDVANEDFRPNRGVMQHLQHCNAAARQNEAARPPPPEPVPQFIWGALNGDEAVRELKECYEKVVFWRKNLFMLPKGASEKDYIEEITRLINE